MEIIWEEAALEGSSMINHFKLVRDPHVQIEEIRFLVNQMNREEVQDIYIDMSELTILDSVVIGQLVRIQLALRERGMRLVLQNLSDHAQTVLRFSNLEGLFDMIKPEPPTWDANITTF